MSLPSVGFAEAADQVVERRVADEVAAREGFHPERDRDVTLAGTGRPEDQAADLALEESQGAQLGEALGVQLGLEGHVELLQCLVVR